MKKYVCDMCNKVIENPHKTEMKQFYIGVDTSYFGFAIPTSNVRKKKIDLCNNCYEKIKNINQVNYFNKDELNILKYLLNSKVCIDGKMATPYIMLDNNWLSFDSEIISNIKNKINKMIEL